MSDNIKVENNADVGSQTIINIENMSGNIAAPQQNILYTLSLNGIPNDGISRPQIALSSKYYNLFVKGDMDFQSDYFWSNISRSVKSNEYTTAEIAERFGAMDENAISQILTFPTLFMGEVVFERGQIIPGQFAWFGVVTDIKRYNKDYRVYYQKHISVPLEQIIALSRELDLGVDFGGHGEITHTHWSVKNADLIHELAAAGIDVMKNLKTAQNAERRTENV